jgi:hypothetical protein
VTQEDVLSFAESSIPSVWALELVLFLKRIAPAGRKLEELVLHLRSSSTAIGFSLRHLQDSGLCVEEAGAYFFRPASAGLRSLVDELEKLYATKPALVTKTIVRAGNMNLHVFANSFRLRE